MKDGGWALKAMKFVDFILTLLFSPTLHNRKELKLALKALVSCYCLSVVSS